MTTTSTSGSVERVAIRTCPLCEATCGLEIGFDADDRVVRVRGDRHDVFSGGFICPKGAVLGRLHEDPDRLHTPLVKRNGGHVEVTWDEAFAEVQARFAPLLGGDRRAIAAYVGNPNAHNLSGMVFNKVILRALGSPNVFSASTVDQVPKHVSSGAMFGHPLSIPVPDIDRTDLFVVLGANPMASNGSLFTAPDLPGRLAALRQRGGRLVVVDPRRSETAALADDWIAIRPGTDAVLLAALVNTVARDGRIDLGHVGEHVVGLDAVIHAVAPFTAHAAAAACGVEPAVIETLADRLASTRRAVVYGRIGTCTQEFGTLASWLVDVVNVITGHLDRPGGAMFPKGAAGAANTVGEPGRGRGFRTGRRHSRVRGLPEVMGEFPVACMAEEMDTPGEGQIRGLVTIAGNPVASTPNAGRLDAALAGLEAMVSVDVYLNETTRHADVILPPPGPLQRPHFDLVFQQLSCRNVVNWSPAALPVPAGRLREWEILARLAGVFSGMGPDVDPAVVDDLAVTDLVTKATQTTGSSVEGRDPAELVAEVSASGRRGPDRIVDVLVRTGPYGDGFGAVPDGLTLDVLEDHPHGIDLGALEPRIPEVLRTPSGHIELAPEAFVADLDRLASALDRLGSDGGLVLVGRRHLRSNNSWMHNLAPLVKGRARHQLQIHPTDAERVGIVDGGRATVRSRVGEVDVDVEVTDAVRPGVVSLPHGWGHDLEGMRMEIAATHTSGVNSNLLTDDAVVDPLSGNAVLNGIPVEVGACAS